MTNDKKPGSDKMNKPSVAQPGSKKAVQSPDLKAWPDEVLDITFPSKADGTQQPMRYYAPPVARPAPLLVYLHPWSTTYQFADNIFYARWCMQHQWAICVPDFRGPNTGPAACGSELMVQDVLSAVQYAREHAAIDANRIYLLGASGGGYATLLMAGRAPTLWAAASAWVPIYDLKDWHQYCKTKGAGYYQQMENVCGGAPGSSPAADEEYRRRSASAWLPQAADMIVDIACGMQDKAIPLDHSLRAFNVLARKEDRLAMADIDFIDRQRQIPKHLYPQGGDPHDGKTGALDPANLPKRPDKIVNEFTPAEYTERLYFRRCSGKVRVTVFDGGHDIVSRPALEFLSRQEKGKPPVWA